MAKAIIRKIVVSVEETHREMKHKVIPPTRKATAIAVIQNPFAGSYVRNIEPLTAIGAELGRLLGQKALDALDIEPGKVESYGKAAIVGMDGELEHAAAILHPRLGKPLRIVVEKGEALIPSAKKRGGPGAAIDVPLGHKDNAWDFGHFDAVQASVPDAPAADEIVVVIALTDSGRPLNRIKPKTKAAVGAVPVSPKAPRKKTPRKDPG